MLTHTDVGAYLIDSGLLDRRAVPADGLRVRDVSGRNRVLVVAGRGTAGYVVKQAEPRDRDLIAREAAVRRQVVAAEPRLAGCVPAPVAFDAGERILVCALVPDAVDLGAYHARGRFPPLLARGAGRALALLHGLPAGAVDAFPAGRDAALLGVPHDPPPLDQVLALSDAGARLLAVLQGASELCDRLAELQASWRPAAVVHGDLRPSNCMAFPAPGARRRTRLALVDWETARGGDPHADLGAVLGEYLHTWLWSMVVLDGRDLAATARHARHPLRAMRPAIRAFWRAYLDAGARPSLRRAIEFAAGHLVEVAFARAQAQASLDPRCGLTLQLGLNLLTRPAEAAVHLFGLPAGEAAA